MCYAIRSFYPPRDSPANRLVTVRVSLPNDIIDVRMLQAKHLDATVHGSGGKITVLMSHRKQFIYTKTVKTAGTSIESYFERYCMPEGSWQFSHAREMYIGDCGVIGHRGSPPPPGCEWFHHMSAESIKIRAGEALWEKYFKFCVVRNPFEKVVSGFYFFEGMFDDAPASAIGKNNVHIIDRFRSWVAAGNAPRCLDRDKYLIDGNICMDFLIRYENMDTGLRRVCDQLQVPFDLSNLPRLKISNRDRSVKIADYYDSDTIAVVENVFEYELANFSYDVPR